MPKVPKCESQPTTSHVVRYLFFVANILRLIQ